MLPADVMEVTNGRAILEGGPFAGRIVEVDFRWERVLLVDEDRATKGHRYRYQSKFMEPTPDDDAIRVFVYEGIRPTTSRTRVVRLLGLLVAIGGLLGFLVYASTVTTGAVGLLAVSTLLGLVTGVVLLAGDILVRRTRSLLGRRRRRSGSSPI
jgi:hypothetical protein